MKIRKQCDNILLVPVVVVLVVVVVVVKVVSVVVVVAPTVVVGPVPVVVMPAAVVVVPAAGVILEQVLHKTGHNTLTNDDVQSEGFALAQVVLSLHWNDGVQVPQLFWHVCRTNNEAAQSAA